MNELVATLAAVAGAFTALSIIFLMLRKVGRFVRSIVHTVDEIIGVPGNPKMPGISSRLAAIEYELKPNSGKSLKDQIDRLEVWTVEHSKSHGDMAPKARIN